MSNEDVGYVVNFVADLGNGRQVSVTGNLPKGATKEDMNKEFDKTMGAIDRQQAKSASRGVSDELDQTSLRLKSAVDDLARIDEKNKDKHLATNERQQREAAVAHIDKLGRDLDYKRGVHKRLLDESK